jgi:hypothetical protein
MGNLNGGMETFLDKLLNKHFVEICFQIQDRNVILSMEYYPFTLTNIVLNL